MSRCRVEGCENVGAASGPCNACWCGAQERYSSAAEISKAADLLEGRGMTSVTVAELRELARLDRAEADRILGED